jgi:dihydroorotate dehydrogenase electron transfer subunit
MTKKGLYEEKTTIAFNEPLADHIWLMGIKSTEIAAAAVPGQFVTIRIREGLEPLLRRPFSICGTKDGRILVLYKIIGAGTRIMASRKRGEKVSVLGPLGTGFNLPASRQKPLIVGGGIGIAPLCFLAQRLGSMAVSILLGATSAKELIPLEDMDIGLSAVSVATDDGSKGHHGVVTDLLKSCLDGQSTGNKQSVYACGPTPMLRKVAEMTLGRIPCQVSLEAVMACGVGACQGCVVKAAPKKGRTWYRVCKEGPVFQIDQIDWAAGPAKGPEPYFGSDSSFSF